MATPIKLLQYAAIWLSQVSMACEKEKLTTRAYKFWQAIVALFSHVAELVSTIKPEDETPFDTLSERFQIAIHEPSDGSALHDLLLRLLRRLPADTPFVLA